MAKDSQATGITVKLGAKEYRVVPQTLGRIERKLRPILSVMGPSGEGASADPNTLYEVLGVFIPDVMPMHEFRGYASEEAMEKGEGDADADHSPTIPEIENAIEAIYTVNGGDRLARFFARFVNEEVLKRTVSAWLADWASTGLQTSPSPNGGSDPTTSGIESPGELPESGKVPLGPSTGSAGSSPEADAGIGKTRPALD